MCVVVQSSNVSVHKPHVFPRVLKSHKLDKRSNTMARERDRRDRDRPDKDRDRGRDTRSSVNADDVDQLRSQLEEVSGKLERTSQLAVQASRDSGEARSGQQIVVRALEVSTQRGLGRVSVRQGSSDEWDEGKG